MTAPIMKITGQLVSYLICPKCLKNVYINSCPKFFENLFSKYQGGFREGLKEQHCLIKLIDRNGESV